MNGMRQNPSDEKPQDDLAASFFHNIGISHTTEFQTNVGRPVTLVRDGV